MKNVKFAAYIVALVAVVGLSVGFVTHAFSGSSSGVVIENVQTLNLNLPAGQSVGSADVTSDVSGDVVGDASGDVVLGAAAVSTGDLVVNPQNFKNGFLVNGSRVITAGRVLTANTSTVARFVQGGTATALTAVATSTLTAAQICNSSFISVTPVSTTPTITLPSTTTLFASCLGTVGQSMDVFYQAITTSSILAAGAGGTSINSSALTVAAGKAVILRFVHDTASAGGTYLVAVVNLLN